MRRELNEEEEEMGKRWERRGGENEERQKKFEIIEERTRTKKVERGEEGEPLSCSKSGVGRSRTVKGKDGTVLVQFAFRLYCIRII